MRPDGDRVLDLAEWRLLIESMLPKPLLIAEDERLVGGDPGEVVVEIRPEGIRVLRFGIKWVGQLPTHDHTEVARFATTAKPARVARAIVRARAKRLASYSWCSRCREMNPPEWMLGPELCQSCAEKYMGVVF